MNWKEIYTDYEPVFKIIIIVAVAFLLNKLLRTMISAYFKRESARINVDPTAYNFLKNALTFIIVIFTSLSIIYSIPAFKQIAVTLFAGAGIIAAILGFASQTAFSNIINGIFIVMFKPFRIGDVIEIGNKNNEFAGLVEDITLRHTVIRNFENKRIVVPNTVISTEILINRTIVDEKIVRFFEVTISYTSNIDLACQIIADEAERHPLFVDPRTQEQVDAKEPKVNVIVLRLADYGVLLRGYVCGRNSAESFRLMTDLNKSVKLRFDKEGIEIPYPYLNIVQKNP
ncbi:MAG: mechanosensitive ion channel family protein [Candidatus Competibacteraceae bacterium]|nr:mechanosensitive ion channel family protein [Candidatus Competibacteraceae bacterium]